MVTIHCESLTLYNTIADSWEQNGKRWINLELHCTVKTKNKDLHSTKNIYLDFLLLGLPKGLPEKGSGDDIWGNQRVKKEG